MRTGAPWRDLPPELGNWHTTFTRFSRWRKTGVWDRAFITVSGDPIEGTMWHADRQELLDEKCRIAVEYGGFGMAWMGMFNPESSEVTIRRASRSMCRRSRCAKRTLWKR